MKQLIEIVVILSIPLVYLLMIYFYLRLKKTFFNKRFISEIIVGLINVAISAAIKMIIMYQLNPPVDNEVAYFLSCLYTAIGGLQFEGLPYMLEQLQNVPLYLQYMYYGSSILVGLVFVTMLSFAISYEFVEMIKLKIKHFTSLLSKKKPAYYIFTSLTKDSLVLANSISEHHKTNKTKCVIIFSGAIGSFDKNDPICREIFIRGYIYWSVNDSTLVKNKSIIEQLGLAKLPNVSLFAFNINNQIADDEYNASIVFDEIDYKLNYIKSIVKNNVESNASKIHKTHYYILIRNDTNYQAYERTLDMAIARHFNISISKDKHIYKMIKSFIQIRIVNEAELAAEDLTDKRIEVIAQNEKFFADFEDLEYRALFLGFGEKGRAALKHLYVDTTYFNNDEVVPFTAKVYDEALSNISGSYLVTHPMFVNITNYTSFPNDRRYIEEKVIKKCQEIYKDDYLKYISLNSLPRISFHQESCFDAKFFEYIDKKTGKDFLLDNYNCNIIVIALGDDFRNIKLANAIIRDIRQEGSSVQKKAAQLIAINIRNPENICQVDWFEEDELPSTKVIFFGDTASMYTYDKIIDEESAKEYNRGYNILYNAISPSIKEIDQKYTDEIQKTKSLWEKMFNFKASDKATLYDLLKALKKYEQNAIKSTSNLKQFEKNWDVLSIYNKESNASASHYGIIMNKFISQLINDSHDSPYLNINKLGQVEHERWMRFLIASGYNYGPTRDKNKLTHPNIVKYETLKITDQVLDFINVVKAYNIDE